jgi:hypothetical protein
MALFYYTRDDLISGTRVLIIPHYRQPLPRCNEENVAKISLRVVLRTLATLLLKDEIQSDLPLHINLRPSISATV